MVLASCAGQTQVSRRETTTMLAVARAKWLAAAVIKVGRTGGFEAGTFISFKTNTNYHGCGKPLEVWHTAELRTFEILQWTKSEVRAGALTKNAATDQYYGLLQPAGYAPVGWWC